MRVALLPVALRVARRQRRTSLALTEIKPKIEALNVLHAGDQTRLDRETLALYRGAGVNRIDRGVVAGGMSTGATTREKRNGARSLGRRSFPEVSVDASGTRDVPG
ncbi:MAG: YidC/Oxa1 family membrane protein insertase [Gemmatimonadota bacterium]|nr:YidC/Oxa1 family membrane protein insertase [Gemmatimonadota bacterium]